MGGSGVPIPFLAGCCWYVQIWLLTAAGRSRGCGEGMAQILASIFSSTVNYCMSQFNLIFLGCCLSALVFLDKNVEWGEDGPNPHLCLCPVSHAWSLILVLWAAMSCLSHNTFIRTGPLSIALVISDSCAGSFIVLPFHELLVSLKSWIPENELCLCWLALRKCIFL